MNITIEQIDRRGSDDPFKHPQPGGRKFMPRRFTRDNAIPYIFVGAMIVAILLLDAILPLRDLWFEEATLTQLGPWPAWPSLLLFHGWGIIPPVSFIHNSGGPEILQSWAEVPLLLAAFVIIFMIYFAALPRLPKHITWRFLLGSTMLMGVFYLVIPIVTSPDVYSYIAYAHMGVFHDLNPLTTLPTAISSDAVFKYVFWIDQPSAYGPTWIIMTSFMQWVLAHIGLTGILPMLIALRLLGLAMHLTSTRLIWSITGKLQVLRGYDKPYASRARLRATLAFAWNPLLLFEACVNAHNDTTLLVFVLLVVWVLAQSKLIHLKSQDALKGNPYKWVDPTRRAWMPGAIARIPVDLRMPIAAASLLALATCLKINIALLLPMLLFYVWMQAPKERRIKHTAAAVISYFGLIVLSYAPFWQGGAIFNVFSVNPGTYRSINSVAEFLAQFYNSIAALSGFPSGPAIGSPAERLLHTISTGMFVLLYLLMLWRMVYAGRKMLTLNDLIYWMAVAWLLYCAIGSPWFWPWYMVTFFGLYALLKASGDAGAQDEAKTPFPWSFRFVHATWTPRLLSFTMLSLYCFVAWGPAQTFIPGLPGFLWSYFNGLWVWLLPLAGAALLAWKKHLKRQVRKSAEIDSAYPVNPTTSVPPQATL